MTADRLAQHLTNLYFNDLPVSAFSQFLNFSSLLMKQKSYRASDREKNTGVDWDAQCELNNEFKFHAAYSRSLDTLEPCRADRNTSTTKDSTIIPVMQCGTMQGFNGAVHRLYGVTINIIYRSIKLSKQWSNTKTAM